MSAEVNNTVPVHVSLIMDGNGRWAKERGKERVHGHFEGVQSVHSCVQAAAKALTISQHDELHSLLAHTINIRSHSLDHQAHKRHNL